MLPVDHVGILGRDIKTMVNAYRELGFCVTEPERLNAGNRESSRGSNLAPT